MQITEQYTFTDYYDLVVNNVSKRLLTEEMLNNTKEELYEVVYDLYFQEIIPSKAVVLVESFYSKFKKFLY